MDTLFPVENMMPGGFRHYPEIISQAEETELITEISKDQLQTFNLQGFKAKRKVANFGYDGNFQSRTLTPGRTVRASPRLLIEKVAGQLQLTPEEFEEVLLTEYPAGLVINWHRDAPTFDLIAGVSLLSDCTFRLRPHDKNKQARSSVISIPVKSRSLYVLQGISRTDWQQSISPFKNRRLSVALRTMRHREAESLIIEFDYSLWNNLMKNDVGYACCISDS